MTLVEDWQGTYWYPVTLTVAEAHAEDGFRWLRAYTAACSDMECCWHVVVQRGVGGWWWVHEGVTAGPHEHWQEAAASAVAEAGARPRR